MDQFEAIAGISAMDPLVYGDCDCDMTKPPFCFFCWAECPIEKQDPGFIHLTHAIEHTDDCLWARARKLSPPPPPSPEPKVKLRDLDWQDIPGVPPGFPDPWAD
jgi:hypothetical protein